MTKKPRGDSHLKTLPPAVQAKIFAECQGKGYAEVKAWLLAEHGVATSVGSLSAFYSWFPLQRRLEQAATFADTLRDQIAKLPQINLSADQVSTLSQIAFETQAASAQDPELFVELRKLRLKERQQGLAERRLKILEAQAALATAGKAVASDTDLSPEEQLRRYRQIFGGS